VKDCVLFCIHGGEMLNIVRELRKAFGIPIISFTIWEYAEKELGLSQEQMREEGILYSFPQFYREHIAEVRSLSWKEMDVRQREVEKRLGIPNNTKLVSYDRGFLRISDYRTARQLQLINLLFAEKLLSEVSPVFFLGGRESYLRNILADALEHKQVPSMSTTVACHLSNRLIGLDKKGRQLGMPEIFDNLMAGKEGDYDADDIKEADDRLDAFLEKPVRPVYADTYSRSLINCVRTVLGGGIRSVLRHLKLHATNKFDRETGVLEPATSVLQWPAKAYRMARIEYTDFLVKEPDFSRKFFYLPLHYTPEVTDMYYGNEYSHHEGFVMSLVKKLPSDCCLYVKEHTSMVGLRGLGFYKRLQSQYNVEMIHHRVNTFDLIKNCAAVITVTGTAGWEAYLMNRPVVVLGDVFYDFLPGVRHLSLYEDDFIGKLHAYLDAFRPDPGERRAAMRANCLSSRFIGKRFDGCELGNTSAHAAQYAKAVHSLFLEWREWLVCHAGQEGKGA
jgi:hypothetical protein